MSLAQKLILYALLVALIPLGSVGFNLIRIGEGALRERIQEHQMTAASALAAKVSQAVEELASHLAAIIERFDLDDLAPAHRLGLVRMVYRQSADISAAMLIDPGGKRLSKVVFRSRDASRIASEDLSHIAVTTAGVAAFERHLPRLPSDADGDACRRVRMSPVYFPDDGPARVAVALPWCGADGAVQGVLGVEIALRDEVLRLEGIDTGPESAVFVVDSGGRVILHPTTRVGTELTSNGAVVASLRARDRGVTRYRSGERTLAAAYSPVGRLGWAVIVEQPEAVAFAAASQMRSRVLVWIFGTALVVLLSGFIFAGRLRRVLKRMVDGARAFGSGRLDERIGVRTSDEIGELATTMDRMAADLQKSLQALEEWSRTLEVKVEERTAELKDTQAQLLTQSKLAAIGQLGAGVAHEINNPLAGILGYSQLMMARVGAEDSNRDILQKIEAAAKRCKAITVNLLRFSERGLAGRTTTEVNEVVKEVIDAFRIPCEEATIELREEFGADLPVITADSGQISIVLINLLSNAKNAMPDGGVLTVTTLPAPGDEAGVRVRIADTGVGIEAEHQARIFEPFFTTKSVWTGVGLGLSVAYRVVSDHGGRIEMQSTAGEGSTFEVFLPVDPPAETAGPAMTRSTLLE